MREGREQIWRRGEGGEGVRGREERWLEEEGGREGGR